MLYQPTARATHEHLLDLDALERRNRTVAQAWVRFFRKHPEALEHRDWRWVAELSRERLEERMVRRLPELPGWHAAARELSRLDVGRVERAAGAAAARAILAALARPLEALNEHWWDEGLAAGLDDFAAADFASLSGDGAAPRRLLAWPLLGEPDEFDVLLRDFGKQLVAREDLQLVVLCPQQGDGDAERVVECLERAYARHVPGGDWLDVVLWTDPVEAGSGAWSQLTGIIELPGSREGERRAFFEGLDAPRVREGSELARLLGQAPV